MTPAPARVGDPVAAIDTPALVVDLDAMEANLAAMAAFARAHGVRLRPHAKMHRCGAVARLQVAAGAVGVCVQKTGEAEALAACGIGDILITNEVVGDAKLARVAALAKRVRLGICVDSVEGLDALARASAAAGAGIDVYVEVDVGHGRCGVPPAAAVGLAHRVVAHDASGLRFAGLQAYHGSAQHLRGAAEREAASRHAAALARAAVASITAAGIRCPLVTGAGTGTFAFDAAAGVWGELQAGSYLFMDRDYADNAGDAAGPRFAHALFVKSVVMSRGVAHAVVDAGLKAHAVDSGPPRAWQRPLAVGACSDEHTVLTASSPGHGGDALPAIGETVWLVPGHCDPTVNLHDALVAVRGGVDAGRVEAVWPVDARGRSS